ncbi:MULTISPECIES: PqqD family protein [unclassified Butyrivibrio]|jgi:hypothetical protein|uniref:PqqD family protein n=1 Tax=unclassified Butyrivibrio TaxID=2639466 RepID=UPI00047D2FC6|nr:MULTISPECIES: PqqD family protein [unclassified Butyrivibrio]MCR5342636.1 PqqD family protein [Butyrivibrio sp.]
MKYNNEFSVCEVAGQSFLVPTGSKVMDVDKMTDLNETALFIINTLKGREMTKEELLDKMLDEYDVDRETAEADLTEFITMAEKLGVIQS